MSQPYVGEIRIGGWNFAPVGWELCQGQLMSIAEYETLFALFGTTYGGDGVTTFALPDLRGRVPAHQGGDWVAGQLGGQEQVTLTGPQLPVHSHPFTCALTSATQQSPAGNVPATDVETAGHAYIQQAPTVALTSQSIGSFGGSQPHDNLQPYVGLTFIISLYGIFPSQS
jgi:microcystin-dependent protein